MNKQTISRFLPPELNITLYAFGEVGSTNDIARSLARQRAIGQGIKLPAFVVAESQTEGRGRRGNKFFSPAGRGVYLSCIFPSGLQNPTPSAAVIVRDAILRFTDEEITIKWINDLYIGQNKVCGISAEQITDPKTLESSHIIIGIGVNVSGDEFPDGIQACSLGTDKSRSEICAALITKMANEFEYLCGNNEKLYNNYKFHLNTIGKTLEYESSGEKHICKAVGLDDNFGLIVLENGIQKHLSSGEVHIISWE
jgi:BirA family biotin operon repressor/biotin-[acetyl-CoA-carboxylase] ligase